MEGILYKELFQNLLDQYKLTKMVANEVYHKRGLKDIEEFLNTTMKKTEELFKGLVNPKEFEKDMVFENIKSKKNKPVGLPGVNSKEDVFKHVHEHKTVGGLKEHIEKNNIPDSAIVMVQRIEDKYYENNNWNVYLKEGDFSYQMRIHNERINNGEFAREDYPKMTDEQFAKFITPYSEGEIKNACDQYTPIWCPVNYSDEDSKDFLFLDLHY